MLFEIKTSEEVFIAWIGALWNLINISVSNWFALTSSDEGQQYKGI